MKLYLIDGNSAGRAAQASAKLKSGGMSTQAIFNSVKTARRFIMDAPDFKQLWLWDGRAQWRYDLLPEYKSKRYSTPEAEKERAEYKEQVPHIQRALSALGISQVLATVDEADDLAGHFVSKVMGQSPDNRIMLGTGDQDWVQLLRPGVTWGDHRDAGKFINVNTLFEKTGFRTPLAFLEGKCLQGDTSDNIPGVGGIGKKTAPEFLAQFGSVREFWRQVETGEFVPRLKTHKRLASPEGKEIFLRNLKMMQLIRPRAFAKGEVINIKPSFDRDKFEEICGEFAFLSILRDIDTFIRPFESANERNRGTK